LIDTKSAVHEAKQRFQTLNGFSAEDMDQFDSIFHPFSSKEEVRVLDEGVLELKEHDIVCCTQRRGFEHGMSIFRRIPNTR
jgi:hypothetical protein